jgi:AraC-like DNA-binding protein
VVGYLLQRRLQEAMLRLRGSDDKVLAIALDCGFRDLSYFNRQFKSRVGMTPTQYRRPALQGST